jgi:cytidylate kinase
MRKIIVAIDGFSSCGKSTMAKNLSKAVNYTYIDSGAMYRAVTLFALRQGLFRQDTIDEEALRNMIQGLEISFQTHPSTGQTETFLNGENVETDIRSMDVSNRVSPVAALSFVRRFLVVRQQALGREKAVVMDGRDIGTVVFPDAELKIFVTASAEIRARRRFDELLAKGIDVAFDDVLANVRQRDHIDSTRQDSPLRKAGDALELDNTNMTIEEQNEWLLKQFLRVTKS